MLAILVAVPMMFNAVTLWPELTPIANVNDDAAHVLFVERASEAIDRGENPVDFWVPDLELGFPQFAYYQHLPHLAVVAVYRALLGSVDIVTVFNAIRYVLLVAFPLTVLWSMHRMGFGVVASAIGAAGSSLLSTDKLLGIEYDSYLWRGFGVFTQLVAVHLFFVVLALLQGVVRRGRGYAGATIALSALVLSHLLYAYMLAIGAGVIALCGAWRAIPVRLTRLAIVGLAAALIASYLLVPAALTSYYLNASPYLESYKYDSFGAGPILGWLVRGQLLDAGRLPVLTALLGVGILAAFVTRSRPAVLAVALFTMWLIGYFGRPTLGPLIDLFPFHEQLFFHRFIGGVQIAAILLIGFGGAWLWELLRPGIHPGRIAVAVAIAALALFVVLQERSAYYGDNATWIRETKDAIARDGDAQAILSTLAALPSGRVYAGQKRDWGDQLDFGIPFKSTHLFQEVIFRGLPTFATPVQGPSLNSDLVFDFDPSLRPQYAAFGVTYVIAPSTWQPPEFLAPLRRTPLYTLFGAPVSAAARYAAVADTVRVPAQQGLLPVMRGWLLSGMPAAGQVLRISYPASPAGTTGATAPGCSAGGIISNETIGPDRVSISASCPTTATLVLPMTFHPNWHVTSDGAPVDTFMVSPSVIGVTLAGGTHTVVAEYRSTPMKTPLLVGGGILLVLVFFGRRRIEDLDARLTRRRAP